MLSTCTLYMQHSDNRCTVYVSNIQHHFGDNDLQELFKQVRGSVCVCVCMCAHVRRACVSVTMSMHVHTLLIFLFVCINLLYKSDFLNFFVCLIFSVGH